MYSLSTVHSHEATNRHKNRESRREHIKSRALTGWGPLPHGSKRRFLQPRVSPGVMDDGSDMMRKCPARPAEGARREEAF